MNHYYKVKQRFPNKNDFVKNLFKVNEKKKMGHLEIEHGVIILNYINAKLLN